MPLWKAIDRELSKKNRTVGEVRKMFINPQTGKPYSAKHIWWIRKQLGK